MKNLLRLHYIAIKKRGLISAETTLDQFLMKLEEEYIEVQNAYADDCNEHRIPSSDLIYEMTDMIMVALNCFQHYGIDFEKQLRINLKRQEQRIHIVSKGID